MGITVAIATREEELRELQQQDAAMMPLGHTLGFVVEAVTAHEAIVSMACGEHLHNVFGYAHGGAIFALADTAIGLASVASLSAEQTATTVESKINYFRPALSGTLHAHAHCVKQGHTLSFFECNVLDDEDRLIAKASATMMMLEGEHNSGRQQLYCPATPNASEVGR